MTKEQHKNLATKHDNLILLLDQVAGNKNRKRILEKIALLEIILIFNNPNENLEERKYFTDNE